MSTTTFDAFLGEVLPYVHDCPQLAAVNAVRNAVIEFCEKSHYWQVDAAPVDVDMDSNTYTIPVPDGTVVLDIIEGWFAGRLLVPKSGEELSRMYRWTDWRSVKGRPNFFTRGAGAQVLLVPTPQESLTAGLSMRVAIAPSRVATGVDTDIFEKFLEIIAKGARARLYGTPGQPYYDAALAATYRKDFTTGIGEARIKANKGSSRASVAVEFTRFA